MLLFLRKLAAHHAIADADRVLFVLQGPRKIINFCAIFGNHSRGKSGRTKLFPIIGEAKPGLEVNLTLGARLTLHGAWD